MLSTSVVLKRWIWCERHLQCLRIRILSHDDLQRDIAACPLFVKYQLETLTYIHWELTVDLLQAIRLIEWPNQACGKRRNDR